MEGLGNLANIHWFVVYLLAWVAFAPCADQRRWAWAGVALIGCLTEPQSALLLPVVFARVWRDRRRWPLLLGWGVGVGVQAATMLVAPRDRHAHGGLTAMDYVSGYLTNAFMSSATVNAHVQTATFRHGGWWPILGAFVAVVALAGLGLKGSNRWALAGTLLGLSAFSWIASVYVNGTISFAAGVRFSHWGTAAGPLLVAVLVVAATPRVHVALRSLGLGILVASWILAFPAVLASREASPAPTWREAVARTNLQCARAAQVEVPTFPNGWHLTVPCSRLR